MEAVRPYRQSGGGGVAAALANPQIRASLAAVARKHWPSTRRTGLPPEWFRFPAGVSRHEFPAPV